MAEVLRERVSGSGAEQALVRVGDDYFWVSSVLAYDTGKFETLAFPTDEAGDDWGSVVAGGIGRSRDEVIAQLERGERNTNYDELDEELGGPIGVFASVIEGVTRFGSMSDDSHPSAEEG